MDGSGLAPTSRFGQLSGVGSGAVRAMEGIGKLPGLLEQLQFGSRVGMVGVCTCRCGSSGSGCIVAQLGNGDSCRGRESRLRVPGRREEVALLFFQLTWRGTHAGRVVGSLSERRCWQVGGWQGRQCTNVCQLFLCTVIIGKFCSLETTMRHTELHCTDPKFEVCLVWQSSFGYSNVANLRCICDVVVVVVVVAVWMDSSRYRGTPEGSL